MEDVPQTIFKYEPFSLRALQNLKCHSVYFGSPSSFNDPFDCALTPRIKEPSEVEVDAISARIISNPKSSEQIKQLLLFLPKSKIKEQLFQSAKNIISDQRNDFNNVKGVTCFSECNDNMLMWSHYGGQHKGFCLEFRTDFEPFTKLRQVKYSPTIPEVDMARFMIENDYEQLLNLFCTKSSDWEYEREWRAIHAKAGTIFTYDAAALKSIYFGAKMTDQDIDMICLILHGQNPDVQLHRGHRSDTKFNIEFTSFTYTPLAEAKRKGLA